MKRTAAHKSVHIRWIEFERIEDRLIGVRLGSIDTFSKRKKNETVEKVVDKRKTSSTWNMDTGQRKKKMKPGTTR